MVEEEAQRNSSPPREKSKSEVGKMGYVQNATQTVMWLHYISAPGLRYFHPWLHALLTLSSDNTVCLGRKRIRILLTGEQGERKMAGQVSISSSRLYP